MPQAPTASSLSPAAKKLQHVINTKLPTAHDQEAIGDVLKVVKACSKEELTALALQPPAVPSLDLTSYAQHQPLATRLQAVQTFISSFQYNSCIGYNYNVAKKRPLHSILGTAAGILMHSLPIKCIEAVFLGILLTQGWSQLQRLPLGFKSKGADGQVYRHIVLAVCDTATGLYGAVGISRCSQLMDKTLTYSSLSALVDEYHRAYTHVKHELLRVRVGLPVEHDPAWMGPVCWRYCTVNMQRRSWQEAADLLNKHAAAAAQLQQQFKELSASIVPSRGTQSVPQSPRAGPAGAHISRPQSPLTVRCSTPASPEQQHMPGLGSPRRQQTSSIMWHSPASSCCSSPTAARCQSPILSDSNAQYAKSPRMRMASPSRMLGAAGARPCARQLLDSVAASGVGSCTSPRFHSSLLACADVQSSCDVESSDDGNDSDSEVNCIVQQMLHHHMVG